MYISIHLDTYMANLPAAKRPAEIVRKVTKGYEEVGMGAPMGVPAIQSSYLLLVFFNSLRESLILRMLSSCFIV